MPYKRDRTWWVRVPLQAGRGVRRSTGTRNRAVAAGIENTLASLEHAREWDVLAAVAKGTIALGTLYDQRTDLTAIKAQLHDIDLRPLAATWKKTLKIRGLASSSRYYAQVSKYLSHASTRSSFDRATLSRWLSQSLSTGSSSTRNRYRAALSVFGSWLVERGTLMSNPLREVRGFGNARPRVTWIERTQAETLVKALPEPYRQMAALMCGTGMEMQAVLRLRKTDVEETARTVFANGGKTKWRQRTVRCTEDWAWPLFAPALEGLTPYALVLGRGTPAQDNTVGASMDYHMRQVLALPAFAHVPKMTPHDFRHCYAVWNLRDGMNPRTVQRQLGHARLSMTIDVYGAFIPDRDSDYELPVKRAKGTP